MTIKSVLNDYKSDFINKIFNDVLWCKLLTIKPIIFFYYKLKT